MNRGSKASRDCAECEHHRITGRKLYPHEHDAQGRMVLARSGAECWTCEPLPDGTSTYPVRATQACRAALHDVRGGE